MNQETKKSYNTPYSEQPSHWKKAIAQQATKRNRELLESGINKQLQFNLEIETVEKFDEVIQFLKKESGDDADWSRANTLRYLLASFCEVNNIDHNIELKQKSRG